MVSSEVQRTLVKSPPELWAEISDPDSLARHLGEFGQIHITRVEPEQRVEWEAGDTSGSVVIKPSGWGTKVKLTVSRELDVEIADDLGVRAAARSELESEAESAQPPDEPQDRFEQPESVQSQPARPDTPAREAVEREPVESEPAESWPEPEQDSPPTTSAPAVELAAEATAEAGDEPEPHDEAVPEPLGEADRPPLPRPRRGFFARLFARRRAAQAIVATAEAGVEPDGEAKADAPESVPARYNALAVWASQIESEAADDGVWEPEDASVVADEPVSALARPGAAADAPAPDADVGEAHEQVASADAEAPPDISAEIAAAEEVASEQVTAVLTGVLDRLGAAHHRPFSRS